MPSVEDLVHETATTTGTGNFTVSNVSGKQSFNSAFGTGGTDLFFYFISHRTAAEWEQGTGHLSAATTLVRDTVWSSSNSNAAVNFSAGTKDVTCDLPAVSQGVPRGHIAGLTLSNNGTDAVNDIDIAIGMAADSTNAVLMTLASALTKRIDAAWAVGSGNGGLDGTESVGGTPDVSTWYHVWLIRRPDTGVVDALFSESATAPTMPTNYTQKRRLGAVYNNSSGDIRAFTQNGDEFLLNTSILDVNSSALTTASTTYTVSVPTGLKVNALMRILTSNGAAGTLIYIRSLDEADLAPSASAAPLGSTSVSIASGSNMAGHFNIRTDTSAQLAARSDVASTTIRIATFGWIDSRGRYS
jgi:hypothetical protein